MPTASGVPAESLIVGETALALYRRLLVDANGVLQVNLEDNALRDLGIVDLGLAVPGSTQSNNAQVASADGSAVQAAAARNGRSGITLVAITDNVDIYYGFDAGVTTADGILFAITKSQGTKLLTQAGVWLVGSAAFTVAVHEDYD